MPLLLVALFIIVPIAELAIIIQVGQAIGVWWTIALLIADSILGSLLMRSQGRAASRRFNQALQGGRAPAREVADGVLIIFGGALLLTPGFLSDIAGLLFLLPPTRALIRREAQVAALRATVDAPHARWSVTFDAEDGQGFALEFAALGEPVASEPGLGGIAGYEQPCQVTGTVRAAGREHTLAALGQRGRAWGDPDWERIELARSVGAWTDAASAALTAVRPAGASNHAEEATWAAYWEPERTVPIEDGRLSTTYDGEGRMRRAGLELWPAEEDSWARRAVGEVLCGSSLDLGALRLDCAFFRWHLEGRTGVGRYDILRRAA